MEKKTILKVIFIMATYIWSAIGTTQNIVNMASNPLKKWSPLIALFIFGLLMTWVLYDNHREIGQLKSRLSKIEVKPKIGQYQVGLEIKNIGNEAKFSAQARVGQD